MYYLLAKVVGQVVEEPHLVAAAAVTYIEVVAVGILEFLEHHKHKVTLS